MKPILEGAPDRVVTVRDVRDTLCGMAIAVTPETSSPVIEADLLLGPWLAHARAEHPGEEVLLWRDSLDFIQHGDLGSPVLSILNTAAILRSGLDNPRWSYLPIDPENSAAVAFAQAVNATHLDHLDVVVDAKTIQCHQVDHQEGIMGAIRNAIYGELGLGAAGPVRIGRDLDPLGAATLSATVTADDVREALRNVHQPVELATSPLARGATPEARAASVRAELEDAVANAFGDSPDEQLLRAIVQRGYLDPSGGHERAADELHVSRATYFRRLKTASGRVADYLAAKHA
jgi:hypothetical protein